MMRLSLFFFLALAADVRATDTPLDLAQTTIKFTGHAFLHDFLGEARDFHGSAQIDPGNPTLVTSAVIDIATAKMTTFETTRDQNMRDWLHVDTQPRIEFHLAKVTCLTGDPARATRDHPAPFSVLGDLTLNKITKPLATKVLGWREGNLLVVTGAAQIDTTAYGLPIVRQFFLTVNKDVDITFHLVFDLPRGV